MAKYVSISDITCESEAHSKQLLESRRIFKETNNGYDVLSHFFEAPNDFEVDYNLPLFSKGDEESLSKKYNLNKVFTKRLSSLLKRYQKGDKKYIEKSRIRFANERQNFIDNYASDKIIRLSTSYVFFRSIGRFFAKLGLTIWRFIVDVFKSLILIFVNIYRGIKWLIFKIRDYFVIHTRQFHEDDAIGKTSYFLMGFSSLRNKQVLNGVLYLLSEALFILFMGLSGVNNLILLVTLGTKTPTGSYVDDNGHVVPATSGDNSLTILLYGIITIFIVGLFIYIYTRNMNAAYRNNKIIYGTTYSDSFQKKRDLINNRDAILQEAIASNIVKAKDNQKFLKKKQIRKFAIYKGNSKLEARLLSYTPLKQSMVDIDKALLAITRDEEKYHREFDRFNDYYEVNDITHLIINAYKKPNEFIDAMNGGDHSINGTTSCNVKKKVAINHLVVHYDIPIDTAKMIYKLNLESNKDYSKDIGSLENKLKRFNEINDKAYHGRTNDFKSQINSMFNDHFAVTVLALPTISAVLICVLPLIFSILIAFTNYGEGHMPPNQLFTWVLFENFAKLFGGSSLGGDIAATFGSILLWTIVWAFFATFLNYVFGIILALLINAKGIKLKKMWRTIFVITIAIPQFVSLLAISRLLGDNGAINTFLQNSFNFTIPFLSDPTLAKVTVIIVNLWVGVPYTMLISTGILMNIPGDLYESARIDGAGPAKSFMSITLPYMLFVTGPYLITTFIGNINNFNVIFFLTGGGPFTGGMAQNAGETDLLITWLYRLTTGDSEFALASTIGIIVFVLCAFFSLIMYSRIGSTTKEEDFQ